MSFLTSAFSGASNNYTPIGTQTANSAFSSANTGLNNLAAMLTTQAQGGGPNLANQLLANATGQNIAQQGALMAGQRGVSSNTGLIARQIAQQGAGIQQQSAGQAASNRLAQQLASQQQLEGVYGTQGSLGANVLNTNNQIGASIAQQNAQLNQNILGGIAAGGMGLLTGGMSTAATSLMKNPIVTGYAGADTVNAFSNMGAKGGGVENGSINPPQQPQQQIPSFITNFLQGLPPGTQNPSQTMSTLMAKGGQLPFSKPQYKGGGKVVAHSKDEKATVPGNSYSNDKVPAMLSEGEIVIPRDIAMRPDAPQAAAQFVQNILSKKRKK